MSDLADRFRREGMADAVVLLVLSRTHPTTTAEEWGRILGLQQHEVRAAIERLRESHGVRLRPVEPCLPTPIEAMMERNAEIIRRRAAGESLKDLAVAFHLSTQRIGQILAKAQQAS